MRNEFSTLDIVKAIDIPRERLRDWMNRGFISPSISAEGQGTKAVFTRDDIYGIALFRNLVGYGFSREVAGNLLRDFTDKLNKEKNDPDSPQTVYVIFRDSKNGQVAKRFGPGAWKFDLETGNIDWPLSNEKFKTTGNEICIPADSGEQLYKDSDWRNIHIVNFGTLRQEVDAGLSRV